MNTLIRTLIQDPGYSNGFEWVIKSESNLVTLGSARHPITVDIPESQKEGAFNLAFSAHLPLNELKRALNREFFLGNKLEAWNHNMLGVILKRAAELGIALPDTPEA
ncbi:MAG: hypothetical protein LBD93_09355 [Treponema sp.]|nr:hypothetical protein [Treponema sp.]